jgi:hypothetical protein
MVVDGNGKVIAVPWSRGHFALENLKKGNCVQKCYTRPSLNNPQHEIYKEIVYFYYKHQTCVLLSD